MRLIKPSVQFRWCTPEPLKMIECAGRTCYKSEDKITEDSAEKFVRMLIARGHEAMLEHASLSYRFICDRGVTHEIVRHRLFSYAQESTRYCNYKGGVTFIIPCWLHNEISEIRGEYRVGKLYDTPQDIWLYAMSYAEDNYQDLTSKGWTPQQARSVLPNSLKTEIIITGNFREWRHFFKLRCDTKAHPQMQEIANMCLASARQIIPVIFEDVK